MRSIKRSVAIVLIAMAFLIPIAAPAGAGTTTWLSGSTTSSNWWYKTGTIWGARSDIVSGDFFTVWASAKYPNGTNYPGASVSISGHAIFVVNQTMGIWFKPRCKIETGGDYMNRTCRYIW